MFSDLNSRITNIDLIRGVVILMILVININYFALPNALRYNPQAFGGISQADIWTWFVEYAFVKQRFMTLLALLYGVGIVLFANKYESKGLSATKPYLARSFLLLIFALIHAYLIWYGDILYAYALAGILVYFCRGWSSKWLISIGLLFTIGVTFPDIWNAVKSISNPPEYSPRWLVAKEEQATMLQQYQGSWVSLIWPRMNYAWYYQTEGFYLFNLWRCGGLMMIGMGLTKAGLFQGKLNYKPWTIIFLLVGLAVSATSSYGFIESNFSYQYSRGFLALGFFAGSITLGLSYLGLLLWWSESKAMQWLKSLLIKAGRMAFTLYIMQSVICGLVFYGYGLDMFGKASRFELTFYTLGIWLFQLLFVVLWFKYFNQGPLESIWRKGYQLAESKK